MNFSTFCEFLGEIFQHGYVLLLVIILKIRTSRNSVLNFRYPNDFSDLEKN